MSVCLIAPQAVVGKGSKEHFSRYKDVSNPIRKDSTIQNQFKEGKQNKSSCCAWPVRFYTSFN